MWRHLTGAAVRNSSAAPRLRSGFSHLVELGAAGRGPECDIRSFV